jgi:hypothetical protein
VYEELMICISQGGFAPAGVPVVPVIPSSEDYRRHSRRFGSECVAETARQLGSAVTPVPKSAAKRQWRMNSSVREQVLGLHRRGVVPAAIADTLNLSGRRVREILNAA